MFIEPIEIIPRLRRLKLRGVPHWPSLDISFSSGLNIITERESAIGIIDIYRSILQGAQKSHQIDETWWLKCRTWRRRLRRLGLKAPTRRQPARAQTPHRSNGKRGVAACGG
jgi:hypothetical protein